MSKLLRFVSAPIRGYLSRRRLKEELALLPFPPKRGV